MILWAALLSGCSDYGLSHGEESSAACSGSEVQEITLDQFDVRRRIQDEEGNTITTFLNADGWLQLTPATQQLAAVAVYREHRFQLEGLHLSMEVDISQGTGGDGMAILFIEDDAHPLGGSGGCLAYLDAGYCPGEPMLSGIAVEIDTFRNQGGGIDDPRLFEPMEHHFQIVRDGLPEIWDIPPVRPSGPLRRTFLLEVWVQDGELLVELDGSELIFAHPLPAVPTVPITIGFSAATGRLTDVHSIREPVVSGCLL